MEDKKKDSSGESVKNIEKPVNARDFLTQIQLREGDNNAKELVTQLAKLLVTEKPEMLEYMTRLTNEGMVGVLQNKGIVSFLIESFSEMKITQIIEKRQRIGTCICGGNPDCIVCGGKITYVDEYLYCEPDYSDVNRQIRQKHLGNYDKLIDRYMRLRVSLYGLGRDELLRLLGAAVNNIWTRITNVLPFGRGQPQ